MSSKKPRDARTSIESPQADVVEGRPAWQLERSFPHLTSQRAIGQDSRMQRRTQFPLMPTAGEHELLEILWRLGEGTIDDILKGSGESPPPNYKTVQTLLRIMENKSLVTHRLQGRAFVYTAQVRRDQVNRISIRAMLQRHFGGSRTEFLVNLLDDERIDAAELKQLEELIRRHRNEKQLGRQAKNPET
jgi:BlaI family penicillinase repressor